MSNKVSSTKKLVSASAIMAAGTLISRVLGVIRVILIGFILGYGTRQVDMFTIATMVPNSLYILFAGGALNTVLVPQIVRAIKNDEDGGQAYTNRIMTAFMLIIGVVAVLATIAAPFVTMIYTSAEWRVESLATQYQSIITLTYLTLPQIFFFGAFFLLGQILNARDAFGPMMWAPIANNIVGIAVLSMYLVIWGNQQDHSQAFTNEQMLVLGLGTTGGIIVQTLVLLPFVKKVGFKLRPRFDLRGVGLGRTFSLAKWTIAYVAINQLALAIVNRLATTATATGHGAGVNVYSNANLIFILPHSLITVSLATAMLTQVSKLAAVNDTEAVAAEFTKTTRLALIAIVPAAAAFIALANPMVTMLFSHGSGSEDALWIGWALVALALGLIPFTVQFMCLRTFYALEDTRTPFFLQILIATVNIVTAIVFVWLLNLLWAQQAPAWVAAALGLSYSAAYAVGVSFTWRSLSKRLPALDGGKILLHITRLVLSTSVGAVAAYLFSNWLLAATSGNKLAALLANVVGGLMILASYVAISKALKVKELANLSDLVASRFGRRGARNTQLDTSQVSEQSAIALLAEEATTGEGNLAESTIITRVIPAIRDDLDGPATIVRNRPAFVDHAFDEPIVVDDDEPLLDDDDAATDLATDEELQLGSPIVDEPIPADEPSFVDSVLVEDEDADEDTTAIAEVGTLLNARYELVERLAARGAETWRAHDLVLSRDVVVHIVAEGDPRIEELMLAARKGAAATDSRFLRVLDANTVEPNDEGIGAYAVAEYATGISLTQLLQQGPLSSLEAAYVARELADALAGVHSQGLFHEEINPDNVIITTSGAVRIVGFGIESVLAGIPGQRAWAERESADVISLGKVLYAMLARHWPGEDAWGLPTAPIVAGETAPVRNVALGISPALDRIASAVLTQRGAASERRIVTAAQLATSLNEILGTADASADLEQRVQSWSESTIVPVPRVVPTQSAAALAAPIEDEPTAHTDIIETAEDGSRLPYGFSEREPNRPRKVLWGIVIAAILTLVCSLAIVGFNDAKKPTAPTTTGSPNANSTAAESAQAFQIASIKDFDPKADGGGGDENPDQVKNAIDGNSATSWSTTRYHNRANMGGLKPGVGLVLDLGEKRTITAATIELTGPSSIELRVPKGDNASMDTEKDWQIVASNDSAQDKVELTPASPVETRWVLVYVTKMPQVATARYATEIKEITLR